MRKKPSLSFGTQRYSLFLYCCVHVLSPIWLVFGTKLRAKTSNFCPKFEVDGFMFVARGMLTIDIIQTDGRTNGNAGLMLIKRVNTQISISSDSTANKRRENNSNGSQRDRPHAC